MDAAGVMRGQSVEETFMFTGLIQDVGVVDAVRGKGTFAAITLSSKLADESLGLGDSLAVNGVCLTAVECCKGRVTLEAVAETLQRTNIGALHQGGEVNLERPLRLGDRLDGHWVLGHVDTVVDVQSVMRVGPSRVMRVSVGAKWLCYIVEKGSVALDGVSLTVSLIDEVGFEVSLVPHTLKSCTLGEKKAGDRLNLETDILAKHLAKYVSSIQNVFPDVRGVGGKGIDEETLRKYGF